MARRNNKIEYCVEETDKKKKRKGSNIVVYIISIIIMLLTIFMSYKVYKLVNSFTFLPAKYIQICLIVLVVICAFFSIIAFLPNINNLNKILQIVVCTALSVLLIFVNTYLPTIKGQLERTFTDVPTEGNLMINVYVRNDSGYETINDLAGKVVGVQASLDKEYQDYALKVINRELEGVELSTVEYDDIYSAVEALYNNQVDGILLNETYVSIISDNDDFLDFSEKNKAIYSCVQKISLEYNTADVGDITTSPFVILVGGNDQWVANMAEDTSYVGRTDVQMLVVVNPVTKQVLIISIPRDSYVPLFGNTNCYDKLTHASIYGYDAWINTVSYFMNVDINYFVRINFASLVNIIDAIGGIDLDNPYYFESAYCLYYDEASGKVLSKTETYPEGEIHLTGSAALGYVRERYYVKADGEMIGDIGRNAHQSLVLKAMIKKMTEVQTITHISDILKSIEGSFVTNVNTDQIYALVQMQLDDMANWDIIQYSLTGYGSMETSYAMGQNSGQLYSVYILDNSKVNEAKNLIQMMLNNQLIEN